MIQSTISAWLKKGASTKSPSGRDTSKSEGSSPSDRPPENRKTEEPIAAEIQPSSHTISVHPKLPPNLELSQITAETLPQFKKMISVLLPVSYSEKFFKEILTDPVIGSVSSVALWTDRNSSRSRVVSGIKCRIIERAPAPFPPDMDPKGSAASWQSEPCLYISSIGTLAPYRNHGIAGALLRRVIQRAFEEHGVDIVSAHVWEANDEARAWYAKLGFSEVSYESGYYQKNINPKGAYVLNRRVRPSDFLDGASRPSMAEQT